MICAHKALKHIGCGLSTSKTIYIGQQHAIVVVMLKQHTWSPPSLSCCCKPALTAAHAYSIANRRKLVVTRSQQQSKLRSSFSIPQGQQQTSGAGLGSTLLPALSNSPQQSMSPSLCMISSLGISTAVSSTQIYMTPSTGSQATGSKVGGNADLLTDKWGLHADKHPCKCWHKWATKGS